LAPERRRQLDTLLDAVDGQTSSVAELRRRATRSGVKELLGQVAQYRRLVALGAAEIDVTALPPARRRALEELGRRMTAQQLRRLEPASTSSAARPPVNATSSPSSAASSR
jgi:hypothetical protein